MKLSITNALLFIISLAFVAGSCKKEEEEACEKNNTGTITIVNNTKETLNIENNGVWITELAPGGRTKVETNPGQHVIAGSRSRFYYATVEVIRCSSTTAYLAP